MDLTGAVRSAQQDLNHALPYLGHWDIEMPHVLRCGNTSIVFWVDDFDILECRVYVDGSIVADGVSWPVGRELIHRRAEHQRLKTRKSRLGMSLLIMLSFIADLFASAWDVTLTTAEALREVWK